MPCRLSQKEHVNIPLDVDKPSYVHTRHRTYITNCKNELLKYGSTFVCKKWQIDELQKMFEKKLSYCYNEKDEVYYAIKNFLEEGYKISELMDILRYAFEEYEFEKENE